MSFSTHASHFLQFPYMPSREASTYLRQMKRSFQKQWTTLPLSISASLPRVIARVGARHKLSLTSSVRVSSRHPPLARRTQYELARWQAGHGYHAFNRTRRYGPSTWRSSVARRLTASCQAAEVSHVPSAS